MQHITNTSHSRQQPKPSTRRRSFNAAPPPPRTSAVAPRCVRRVFSTQALSRPLRRSSHRKPAANLSRCRLLHRPQLPQHAAAHRCLGRQPRRRCLPAQVRRRRERSRYAHAHAAALGCSARPLQRRHAAAAARGCPRPARQERLDATAGGKGREAARSVRAAGRISFDRIKESCKSFVTCRTSSCTGNYARCCPRRRCCCHPYRCCCCPHLCCCCRRRRRCCCRGGTQEQQHKSTTRPGHVLPRCSGCSCILCVSLIHQARVSVHSAAAVTLPSSAWRVRARQLRRLCACSTTAAQPNRFHEGCNKLRCSACIRFASNPRPPRGIGRPTGGRRNACIIYCTQYHNSIHQTCRIIVHSKHEQLLFTPRNEKQMAYGWGGGRGIRCASRAPSLQCRSCSFMSLCGGEVVQSDGICSVLHNASTLLEHDAQVEMSVEERPRCSLVCSIGIFLHATTFPRSFGGGAPERRKRKQRIASMRDACLLIYCWCWCANSLLRIDGCCHCRC